MKNRIYNLAGLIVILLFVVIGGMNSGCSNDPTSGNSSAPPQLGYEQDVAGVSMTLAALAYVAENNPIYIRDSLILLLQDSSYATEGEWELAWGPGISQDQGNVMYVAKSTSGGNTKYAIAIRGTDWCFPINWKEDILVWDLVKYPYVGDTNVKVAKGTLDGLNTLLTLRDSATNKTLSTFLNEVQGSGHELYITGHSLGGALATIMTSALLDIGYGSKFNVKSYTFAAPSIGNEQYVQHFSSTISSNNAISHRIMHRKDLVPYFWDKVDSAVFQNIPSEMPFSVGAIMLAINAYLEAETLIYKPVATLQVIPDPVNPSTCGVSSVSLDNYACWVGYEHSHNTYLRMLGVDTVAIQYSPCDWESPN